jgi:outer membrane receptor protein involved in Fe transport
MFPADNGLPKAGGSTFTGTLFNTTIDDLGNTINDLKLTKTFGEPGARTTVAAGLFTSKQNVALTWFWNQYTVDMKNSGAKSTFATAGWDTWGGCCTRNFDVGYTTTSPYASVTMDMGALTLDGSIRHDSQSASGYQREDDPIKHSWDAASQKKVDYKLSHTSYSLGGNYQLNRDLALFGRVSNGVAFNADRLLYGNPLDGSVPVAFNKVEQVEGGAKWRAGAVSVFATLFNAKTTESNYEATTRKFTSNKYSANGLELELGYKAGDFRLTGGATFTSAEITASNDASTVGKKPRRQADVVLQVSPSFSVGPVELGAGILHTGKSYGDDANTITMPAYTVLNAFVNYQVNDKLQLSVSANNLGNAIGYTEVEGDGHAARSINGRSIKASLKYAF